jgi:hypothetical protein
MKLTATAQLYADNLGWRQTAIARTTGLPVSIYDGEAAGMDTAGGRWQTICEPHGEVISHETLALARYHAAAPDEWCEVCMGVRCEHCGEGITNGECAPGCRRGS